MDNQFEEQARAAGVQIPGAPAPQAAAPAQPAPSPTIEEAQADAPTSDPVLDEALSELAPEDEAPASDEADPREGAIRAKLQQRRAELAGKRAPFFLPIEGWDELTLRCKFVRPESITKDSKKIEAIKDDMKRIAAGSTVTLIRAADEFMIRVSGEEGSQNPADYRPLSQNGIPCKFDAVMIQELGGDPNVFNSAVKAVNFLYPNPYVLIGAAREINDWLVKAKDEKHGSETDQFELDFVEA